VFLFVASVRGNHWHKTEDECIVLGSPIASYLNSLPGKSSENIVKLLHMLISSIAIFDFFNEPLRIEYEMWKVNRENTRAKSLDKQAVQTGRTPPSFRVERGGPQGNSPTNGSPGDNVPPGEGRRHVTPSPSNGGGADSLE
jgi:hypothetical protein